MVESDERAEGYLLAVGAVRRAIEVLVDCPSHEHLPGYLALLRKSSGELAGMADIEEFYTNYLSVSEAPSDRPYLRPFLSRGKRELLLNRNLAGSYAPSSIRPGKPFAHVVELTRTRNAEGSHSVAYVLVDNHAARAFNGMLSEHKIPAVSLAIFLFRDRCLRVPEVTIGELRGALREFLCIGLENPEGNLIFDTLFGDDSDNYQNMELAAGRVTLARDGESELKVSEEKVRDLTLTELGLGRLVGHSSGQRAEPFEHVSELDSGDGILGQVREARRLGFAGAILSGPPGTGKSWYAQQVGVALTGQWENVRSVQFHPSYQYEDFMCGYVPGEDGRFELQEKEFVQICRDAAADRRAEYVLVIDEISRSDVVRIFGEALTYIASDKRGQPFSLACGRELMVPENLFIIGTMNSWDKGVDELDVALERRFAEVAVSPDSTVLRRLLEEKGANGEFVERVVGFFSELQGLGANVQLGHAYFLSCVDAESAGQVWDLRLRPTLKRACGVDEERFQQIERRWRERMEHSAAPKSRDDSAAAEGEGEGDV